MKIQSNTRTGFTLIEIMIVVAMIASLAALAIPNFLRAQEKSLDARKRQGSWETAKIVRFDEVEGWGQILLRSGDSREFQQADPKAKAAIAALSRNASSTFNWRRLANDNILITSIGNEIIPAKDLFEEARLLLFDRMTGWGRIEFTNGRLQEFDSIEPQAKTALENWPRSQPVILGFRIANDGTYVITSVESAKISK